MLVCLASGRNDTSSGRMEQWIDGRSDGMARSSGRLTGNLNSSDLQAELFHITLNRGIPVTASLHISDFVQTQNKAKILTRSILEIPMHVCVLLGVFTRKLYDITIIRVFIR